MEQGRRKTMVGTVVSTKMDKTAVVAVERRIQHPLYKKIMKRTTRYKAHDAGNTAKLGDVVVIAETRPTSKDKRWRIAETLVRGDVADIAPRDIGAPEELPAEPPTPEATATSEAEAQVEDAQAEDAEGQSP